MIDHDAQPGPLTRCQITGSENLFSVIDLGHQPPCDALLSSLDVPEATYPLALNICPESGLAQLSFVVPGEEIYPPSYPYKAGISQPVVEYQAEFAKELSAFFRGTRPNPLAVDIGSNDGTLLKALKGHGFRCLGVEPTDVADIAVQENNVATVKAFFTEAEAREIIMQHGKVQLVTMTNVFAHMADLGEVMRGIRVLLDSNNEAVFVTESHYLGEILHLNQFDTIYHEHIRTYSLKAIMTLVAQYGLEVFYVSHGSRYGGNIRACIAKIGTHLIDPAVAHWALEEEHMGLFDPEVWARWRARVDLERIRFMNFLNATQCRGQTVRGCSAPGRASTLINYYGMRARDLGYTGELSGSLKLGKFLPGSHIPVVPNTRLIEDQPDYVVLFSWHYADVIQARLEGEGLKSKLVKPLPHVHITE